jgi:hypothetical protein
MSQKTAPSREKVVCPHCEDGVLYLRCSIPAHIERKHPEEHEKLLQTRRKQQPTLAETLVKKRKEPEPLASPQGESMFVALCGVENNAPTTMYSCSCRA